MLPETAAAVVPEPYLARCEPEQAEPIYRLLMAHRNTLTSPVDTLTFAEFRENIFETSSYFYWCDQRGVVAVFWMSPIDHHSRSAEIGGIALEPGKGDGPKGTRALVEYAFSALGLNRLFCTVNANNQYCLKFINNLGFFTPEGRQRQARYINGQFIDLLTFSVLSSDKR